MTVNSGETIIGGNKDEISIRSLLLALFSFVKLLLKNWYWVLLVTFLAGAWSYTKTAKIKDVYPAKIKFLINRQEINEQNKVMLEAFSRLMNTQQIFIKVLLSPISDEVDAPLLINEYLKTYFELKPEELDVLIPKGYEISNRELEKMSPTERLVLKKVLNKISQPMADYTDGFVSVDGDYNLGFITINVSTASEELSLLLSNTLYKEIKSLLFMEANFSDQGAFDKISSETDSLSTAYRGLYTNLNKYKDRRERLLKKEKVNPKDVIYLEKKIHRLEVNADLVKTSYLAALEMLYVSQVDLEKGQLKFQEVERSFSPIAPYRPNPIVAGVKSGIMGGIGISFLLIAISIGKRIVKEVSLEDQ